MNGQYFHTTTMPHQAAHHHVFGAPHMGSQLKAHPDSAIGHAPDPSQYQPHSYFQNPQLSVPPPHQQHLQQAQGLQPQSHHQHAPHPGAHQAQQVHGTPQQQHQQHQQHQQQQGMMHNRKRRASNTLMPIDVNTLHQNHQLGGHLMPEDVKPTQSQLMGNSSLAQMIPMMPTAAPQPTTPTQTMVDQSGMAVVTPTSDSRPKSAKRSRTNVPWTAAEEMKLKEMRERGSSWAVIAQSFPNRTEGGVKKHWYKDMHFAKFERDEGEALVQAVKEYDSERWKIIGQKVGKPAKACEQYVREHYPYLLTSEKDREKAAKAAGAHSHNPMNSSTDSVIPNSSNAPMSATGYSESDPNSSTLDMSPIHNTSMPSNMQSIGGQPHFVSIESGLKNSDPTPT